MGRRHAPRAALARALAAVLLAGLTACSSFQEEPLEPPVVNLRGLEPEAMGLNSQVFRARLGLFNPNTVPLRISRGEVDLELAGVSAAKGRTLAPFTVEAGAETEVDIRVTTHLLRDAPALFSVLSGGGASDGLAYALSGYVYVERRGRDRVPIRSSGTLGFPAGQAGGKTKSNAAPGSAL
jgi:LEA14-like dessication related protein